MSFFSRLFAPKSLRQSVDMSAECKSLLTLKDQLDSLLASDHYLARSEYKNLFLDYQKTVEYFGVLKNSGTLGAYCDKNGLAERIVKDTLDRFVSLDSLVGAHNESFVARSLVKEKSYLDGILKKVDSHILLDEDQRRVVLCDEDYTLVIAGAGAGKTTTVAAKVKYLVDKKQIDPRKILVVSFTNKAVGELKDRLQKDLGINCPIATFHSTGNAILRKNNPEKLNIVDETRLYYVIRDYLRTAVLSNEGMVNNLIMFFASYFDAPFEGKDLNDFFNKIAKANYSSLKSDLNEFECRVIDSRTRKAVTIQNEVLRSYQEVEIANFLYLNNLDYEYEPLYRYDILLARKPYTPDFIIRQGDREVYLEHFGITQDGHSNLYSDDQLAAYKTAIRDKIALHRQHGTRLVYTFSAYDDKRPLVDHLRDELEKNGFTLTPRPKEEVMKKLIESEENRYIRKLVSLLCRFIINFKTNGYTVDEFSRMYHSTTNVRTRLFLDICTECYLEYDRYLKEHDAVDFEDMINESARVLREVKEMKQKLDFDYIIVDEYQDISRQRFDLVQALHEVTDAKIIAVGDDWQSIYAFSGSDITLFTKFREKMGYAQMLKIVKTYRNSQEVIDIAGNFIQRNEAQIKKDLVSPKTIHDPVIIYTYNSRLKQAGEDRRSGASYAQAKAVETALDQIVAYHNEEGRSGTSVLLLGRYGFDGDMLEKSGLFEYARRGNKIKSLKYPRLDIDFMTVHASKGLGYDDVILVNAKNETYGFPSKVEDDPVLSFVIKGDRSIDYAEERRLFYVAMTRTKNRVYMIAPEQNPSEFLLELKHDYKNVVLRGEWNEEEPQNSSLKKVCPLCGFPMQFRYKNAYGLRLFICTNEPEVCGFMTNEYEAGKLCIMKCDQCRDGYLIVKPDRKGGYFLGCTNYKADKTGCGNVVPSYQYYAQMGYRPEDEAIPEASSERVKRPRQGTDSSQQSFEVDRSSGYAVFEKATFKEDVLYQEKSINEAVFLILSGLNHISVSYFYGVNILVDVLRGATSERISKFHLDMVDEYGALKDWEREDIKAVVYWLIAQHYLLRTKEQYPVLHPTDKGLHYAEHMTLGQLKQIKKELEK